MLLLTKGGDGLNLSKLSSSLTRAAFALGWSPAEKKGISFDLDAFVIGVRGKNIIDDDDVLYFNSNKYQDPKTGRMKWVDDSFRQPYIWNRALVHSGDELTGGNEGDDEVITVELNEVPSTVTHLVFCVSIFDGLKKKQNFSQVSNAFIRLDDLNTNESLAQYDLNNDAGLYNGVVMGYLERDLDDWIYHIIGKGLDGDMNDFIKQIHKILQLK